MNLLKALRELIEEQGDQQPYLIPIGERAEQVAQAFEERQTTSRDALAALEQLVRELHEAEEARRASDLPTEAFAVQFFLRREQVAGAETAGKTMAGAFEQFPHWRTSEEHGRRLRTALYVALRQAGVATDTLSGYAGRIMAMLERAAR